MYIPEREKKTDYSLNLINDSSIIKITKEEKKRLKDKFKNEHLIEDGKLIRALKKIKLSQINRFYSLLEDSTSLSSEDIKKFVEKQLERAMNTKDEDDLKTAEDFYEYYKNYFLEEESNINRAESEKRKESQIALELMKAYVCYFNGIKKIEEALSLEEKEEEK